MTRLPILSGEEMIEILETAGFEVQHQNGSKNILNRKRSLDIRFPDPKHKTIRQGLLQAIIHGDGSDPRRVSKAC